jgi:hypothetical protein
MSMNNMMIRRSVVIAIAGAVAMGFAASSAFATAASPPRMDAACDCGACPDGHRNDGVIVGGFALGALGAVLGPTYYVPGYDGSFDGGDPYPYGVRYGRRYANDHQRP